jgi:uncharacterized protein YhfF
LKTSEPRVCQKRLSGTVCVGNFGRSSAKISLIETFTSAARTNFMKSEEIENFWKAFCEANPAVDPATAYQVWFFGNTSEMAHALVELVTSGKKSATASLLAVDEIRPENAPVDNGYSVITDFEGVPRCVIQTTEIRYLPFAEVDAAFAFDEGEGDRTLENWRTGHRRYFTKEAAELGLEFNAHSLVTCERFKLLYSKV